MKVAVIGTGYVGTVTGACLAETGNYVTGIDIDQAKVKQLQKGEVPIFEPQLDEYLKRNLKAGRLKFSTDLKIGISDAEVIFLALPTPPKDDGSADLTYVLDVADKLGNLLKKFAVVVTKSTVPVGTAEKIHSIIKARANTAFAVASNPEFLREGFAISDFMKPDRIVVGTSSAKARKILEELYTPFISNDSPIYFMDERSAEMTKYTANAFLAMKISFINEIANLSELVGADIDLIRQGIGDDERIGHRFLQAGIGYGGSCFPKDVRALDNIAAENGYDFKLLKSVSAVNAGQKRALIKKINKHYNKKLAGKVFGLWGLAFKPDTDDIREAPALDIIDELLEAGAKIQAYDPQAQANAARIYGDQKNIKFCRSQYDAVKNADALLIATEWAIFKSPDFEKLKASLKKPVIFDGRNLYTLDEMRQHGFNYLSIGRAVVSGK